MKKLIIAGGSGFLGQALARHFANANCEIVILTRRPEATELFGRAVVWDAHHLGPWQRELEGATAVINLAGKSVNCRYNTRNREEILNSRVESTRILGQAIGRCGEPPAVWLNASTATIYRHTFGEPWDENGMIKSTVEAKDEFSIEVALAWERAFQEAVTRRTRKIALRMAMVLGSGRNSVFPVLRRLVRLGLGGKMGSGQQFVSWIHVEDYCRAIEWLVSNSKIEGPVNLSAPNPLPNQEMMRILREVSGVPFGIPAPGWALEVGALILRTETELIIKSRRVIPRRLFKSGFQFHFPHIGNAFEQLSVSEYEPAQ